MPKNNKFVDKTPNQTAEFRTKNWVEINDDARRTIKLINTNGQIKFKT